MANKNKFFISLSFVVLIVVITFSTIFFETKENKIIKDFTESHLTEISTLYAVTFDEKLKDQLTLLESQSRLFEDVNMSDYFSIKKAILSTKGAGAFKRISISDLTGMTINYDGRSSGNIYKTDYFSKAVQSGNSQISDKIYFDEDKEPILCLAVPVIQNKKVVGVVTGTLSANILSDLFEFKFLNNESFSFVLSSDNQVIVSNKEFLDPKTFAYNFSDLFVENDFTPDQKQFFKFLDKSSSGTRIYQVNGNAFTCVYTPLSINRWCYAYILPYDYVKAQERQLSKSVYFIILIIILAFILFTYFLQALIKNTDTIEKDNERLKFASSQAQSLIFELNLQKNQLNFSGDTEFILNTRETSFPVDYLLTDFISKIHEDDKSVIVSIKEFIAQSSEDFSNEIRFKCADDNYYWFRFTGTRIVNPNNDSVKLIGNFVNVNAQIIHEQELKTIAETDMLSGLLNKSFTEKKIERYLNLSDSSSICALFIIDLDNFKQTNDTLGHAMGDIAIRDSAKKISLIFSEKDIIGRFGGDEFCVFMCLKNINDYDVAEKIITEKAANLCNILNEEYFDDKNAVTISSSIGISLYPKQGDTFRELFHKADSALYYVKQHGKNNIKFYNDDIPELGELINE